MSETPWLSADEERLWRSWLRVAALLPSRLGRGLQDDAGLSLPDFDVLVQLTDTPEGRVRINDLARCLNWERSRVSHHVTRMAKRGLVARDECVEDGRGAFVVITDAGRRAIEQAAPDHVRTVRGIVLDDLTDDEAAVLQRVHDRWLSRLEPAAD